MKATIILLVLAAALWLPALDAAEGRVFEGVNLDELMQTQQLKDMPEIYERDPANGRRFRLRKAVVQIPLGAAWLAFNAELSASYLNKVPGENAESYFGPIAGDAFEVFKLEEKFIAALRKDYAGDVSYRIDLMLRTGDGKLRERALRIMAAGLASDLSAETRARHLPKFKELASRLEGQDAASLRAAIAQTEKRIDELTVALPDSEYNPGNDELARQGRLHEWMKPSVAVPGAAWGEALDGLRAAAVFSTTESALGEEISVWLLVENASDKEIRFGSSDVMQDARPGITRADGSKVEARNTWFSGLSPIQRHKLRPGERLTLAKKSLIFDDKDNTNHAGFGSSRVAAGPGEYRVRYESILTTGTAWARQDDGLMHRTLPAKGEWSGRLTTAETKIVVAGDAGAAPAEPQATTPAAPVPANRANTRPRTILVNVLDANGKPISAFRVIAGVKFSASAKGEKEVITWQPHTLRAGTDGTLIWPSGKAYDSMALRVDADGYAPAIFAWLDKRNPRDVEVRLTEDKGLAGRVILPDGNPAANAVVALAMVQREAVIENGKLRHAGMAQPEKETDQWRWPRLVRTDERGQFRLPAENDPTAALLVTHDGGVREMALADFKNGTDGTSPDEPAVLQVKLQSWGRIEGRAQWGSVVGSNRNVSLNIHHDSYGYPGVIAQYEKVTTSAAGDFLFERVLPGMVQLSCPMPVAAGNKSGVTQVNLPGMTTHLTVEPGHNSALLGGQGRAVKGRLTGCDSYANVTFHFHPTAPPIGFAGGNEMWSAWRALQQSPLGQNFFRNGLKVNADGTFDIAAVLPGSYQVFFTRAGGKGYIASGKFVVPAESLGTEPAAQNIGELKCRSLP